MTTTPNVCDDPAYLTLLDQKTRFQLLNIPPVRYDNLANNPYLQNFTKFDLDMRRKAETLKYNRATTNKFSKKELYKQAIAGTLQNRTYSNEYISSNSANNQLFRCPNKRTLTTESGVPGPPIYLYEDPNVPLYNYLKDTDAVYGNLPPDENAYETTWSYTSNIDQTTGLDYVLVSSIFILYKDVDRRIYEITIPIGLIFSGSTTVSAPSSPGPIELSTPITTDLFTGNVFYGTDIVPLDTNLQIDGTSAVSVVLNDKISYQSFSGSCYLGRLTLRNVDLLINKGYIYDVKYKSNKTVFDTVDDTYIEQFSFQIIFNISENYGFSTTNCIISGGVDPNEIVPIYISDNA